MTATETISVTVELSRRDDGRGAARIYDVDAEILDFGPGWASDPEAADCGAEARYAYVTHGYLERRLPGGATASRNVVGNPEWAWFDESPAATASALVQLVRAEHVEYGCDPLAAACAA